MVDERTVYITNLHDDVTAEILEEIFTQVGPVESVSFLETNNPRYAFVHFFDEESVPFSIRTLDGIKLFNTPIMVRPRSNTNQDLIFKKHCEKIQLQRQSNNDSAPEYIPHFPRRSYNKSDYENLPRFSQSFAQSPRQLPSILSFPLYAPAQNLPAQHLPVQRPSLLGVPPVPQYQFFANPVSLNNTHGGYFFQLPPRNIPPRQQLSRSNSFDNGMGNFWR
uniref:RRM domain-containing protein n=1 Tax=Panagrolaimus sp. ES5 TaxID=591445 RepID=A0AC34FN28_9BILA